MNRPCLASGCPSLAGKTGYCARHEQPILAERSRLKRLYKSPLHQQWRKVILQRDKICTKCGKAPAIVADHKKPLRFGGDWSYDNGAGMCKACHGRKSVVEDGVFSR